MDGRSLAILAVVLFIVGFVLSFFVDARPINTLKGVVLEVSGDRAVIVRGERVDVSLGNRSVRVGQKVVLTGWFDGNLFVVGKNGKN